MFAAAVTRNAAQGKLIDIDHIEIELGKWIDRELPALAEQSSNVMIGEMPPTSEVQRSVILSVQVPDLRRTPELMSFGGPAGVGRLGPAA